MKKDEYEEKAGVKSAIMTRITLAYYLSQANPSKVIFTPRSFSLQGCLSLKVIFPQRSSFIEGCFPLKVVSIECHLPLKVVSIEGHLPPKLVNYHLAAPELFQTALIPMATLEASLEANSDRQTGRRIHIKPYQPISSHINLNQPT